MLALLAAVTALAVDPFVVDGDGLLATLDGQREQVRIEGIDAPELRRFKCPAERALAEAATREAWRAVLAARTVTVEHDGRRDRYERLLARVRVDGADLGERLIAAGLAVRWTGRRHAWCAR